MTYAQRNTEAGRILYNQLRLNLAFPGETVAGEVRKPYTPVNYDKWGLSYDELMACPDTPRIAYLRTRYQRFAGATAGMRGAA